MRFGSAALQEITGRLMQLGVSDCPVCHGSLAVDQRPALLKIGGFHHPRDHPRHDPDANTLFMVRVACSLCGHTMLFDSEQFIGGDEKALYIGPEEPPAPED